MNNEDSYNKDLVKVCRFFYQLGYSKTEISRDLGISITHVNRLLKEAYKRGIVEITINAPRHMELELQLTEVFDLSEVRIVSYDEDEDQLRGELGREAAEYFDNKVVNGSKVGVGNGRTMFEMLKVLKDQPRSISIYPISVIAQRDTTISTMDANTLVSTLWYKFRPDAKGYHLNLFYPHMSIIQIETELQNLLKGDIRIRNMVDEMLNLDFYFFSTGYLRSDSVIMPFIQERGGNLNTLTQSGITGYYLFNTIDKSGNYISCGLEGVLVTITLNQLKALVGTGKKVILVAGGDKKIDMIIAGLKAGIFNTLITDSRTANKILSDRNSKE